MKKHYVKPAILAEDLKLSLITTACDVAADVTAPLEIGLGDGITVFGGPIQDCFIEYDSPQANGAELCKNIPAAADLLFPSH